jgi:hypothetical protein
VKERLGAQKYRHVKSFVTSRQRLAVSMLKTKLRGLWKVGWQFLMTAAAFNLWRLPKLQSAEV